ncbi:hypothetical protein [Rhizobium sp. FKL33]|uniref:hypothetical protein n=1 Tax=Rhizobium sp. FKL33 TaxID=2562307 RepID=UPI0010BFB989|nr:hypothetical protein [Rhizobium sp. FKL33]
MSTETAEKTLPPRKRIQAINSELVAIRARVQALKAERASLKEKVKANVAARAAKNAAGKAVDPKPAG